MKKLTLLEVIKEAEKIVYAFDHEEQPLKTCVHARDAIELLRNIIKEE